jgi:hypothetical protein
MTNVFKGGGSWGNRGFPHGEMKGAYQSLDYFTID